MRLLIVLVALFFVSAAAAQQHKKTVNGVDVPMTAQEEAAFKAEGAARVAAGKPVQTPSLSDRVKALEDAVRALGGNLPLQGSADPKP